MSSSAPVLAIWLKYSSSLYYRMKIQLFIILSFYYHMKIWQRPIVGHVQMTFVVNQ